MIIKGKLKDFKRDWETGRPVVTLDIEEGDIADLQKHFAQTLSIEIRRWKNRRTLDSNAYAWVLIGKIAEALHSTKEDVYCQMLARYSNSFTHIICKENAIQKVREMYRASIDLGEVQIGNQRGHQLQVYFGSSTFSTKEMAVFIDGLVSECKEMGIETLPPSEIERMKAEWGKSITPQ